MDLGNKHYPKKMHGARTVQATPPLVMAENHIKTDSSGLQYQAYCCYEQEDSSQT